MKNLILLISIVGLPLTAIAQDDFCKGDFDYDRDVDGSDVAVIKQNFPRSIMFEPCPPDGPAPAAKTGQTACYDENSIPRDCAGTGEDGEHQRGVVWPIPRFTDHEDGTATDNLTGLMWLKDTNCMVTHYPEFDNDSTPGFGDVTWQLALNFISGINTGNYPNCGAGYIDWRLPNPKELLSLIDFKNFDPALPSGHPFHNLWFGFYWSSSSYAVNSREAWAVLLYTGRLTAPDKFIETCYVWPVRGGH